MLDCARTPQERGDHHFDPDLRLTGLSPSLFGQSALAWHPIKEGYILGSTSNTICLWDINSALVQHNRALNPMHAYEYEVNYLLRLKISFLR